MGKISFPIVHEDGSVQIHFQFQRRHYKVTAVDKLASSRSWSWKICIPQQNPELSPSRISGAFSHPSSKDSRLSNEKNPEDQELKLYGMYGLSDGIRPAALP